MLSQTEFTRVVRADGERLKVFIARGWISPPVIEGRPAFRDVDIARAALIVDLSDEMGVNDEGIDVVLALLDQLYGLRFAISNLIDALEVQPQDVRRHLVNDARRLSLLSENRLRGRR